LSELFLIDENMMMLGHADYEGYTLFMICILSSIHKVSFGFLIYIAVIFSWRLVRKLSELFLFLSIPMWITNPLFIHMTCVDKKYEECTLRPFCYIFLTMRDVHSAILR